MTHGRPGADFDGNAGPSDLRACIRRPTDRIGTCRTRSSHAVTVERRGADRRDVRRR